MKNWQTFELDTVDEIKNMELLFDHNLIKYYKVKIGIFKL